MGFPTCCNTVYQPEECDKIYTGSNRHGKSCLRPLSQVQKEPQASDKIHTPLHCTQRSNVRISYNNNTRFVEAEQLKAVKEVNVSITDHITFTLLTRVLVISVDPLGLFSLF